MAEGSPYHNYPARHHGGIVFKVEDIIVSACGHSLAIISSIPGLAVPNIMVNLLPVAVKNGHDALRVSNERLNIPEIINAIAIGRKRIGYNYFLINPYKNLIGAYAAI